ncbi:MAG: GAF and ANTAR domain-containing protein [Geodermatophilaceae bacterium]|nr:GAF and ANTAR domain-containing protein [Geodermatophilaceae bacterium]
MNDANRVHDGLQAVLASGGRGRELAERLCTACADLLGVDGGALSVGRAGAAGGCVGSSDALSRELDDLQFTHGEGPSIDAARQGTLVLVPDLIEHGAERWPTFASAAIQRGVRSIFALPVSLASAPVGVLALYRTRPGDLNDTAMTGGLLAAELASLPLLDLISGDLDAPGVDLSSSADRELTLITRVEVYQATGMLTVQLDVGPAEALVRLRGYAFAHDRNVNDVAWDIVERRLRLDADDAWRTHEKDVTP